MEKLLQKIIANSRIESTTEQPNDEGSPGDKILTRPQQQNAPTPSITESVEQSESQEDGGPLSPSEPAIPISHRAAASSILSWKLVPKIVGDVVYDDGIAGTASRLANHYMEYINIEYPILTPTQLELLIQDFMRTRDISNTTPEPNYFEPAGLKRKRSALESPQSSIERALVLLILALGKKFDDAPPECESLPSGSATFRYGYPSPENEKPWIGACLDQPSLYEPGLKYFAAATDIIGRHAGGNSLCHVQVYILASIYHGQRAQYSQRHNYLLEAARALHVFLQR